MKSYKLVIGLALGLMPNIAFAADMNNSNNDYGIAAEMWGGANILGINKGDANDSGLNKGFGLMGGRTSVILDSNPGMVTQISFEGQGNFLSASKADDDQVSVTSQGTVHLLTNNGIGLLGGGGVIGFQDEDNVSFYFGGLEYHAGFDGGSMLLQAGGFGSKVTDGTNQFTFDKAWFVRVAPQIITSDSFSLALSAAYVGGEIDGDTSSKLYSYGVRLQQKLDNSPTSIFLEYDGAYVDGAGGKAGEHTFMAGLRFELGGSTHKEISNPGIARWVGISHRTD